VSYAMRGRRPDSIMNTECIWYAGVQLKNLYIRSTPISHRGNREVLRSRQKQDIDPLSARPAAPSRHHDSTPSPSISSDVAIGPRPLWSRSQPSKQRSAARARLDVQASYQTLAPTALHASVLSPDPGPARMHARLSGHAGQFRHQLGVWTRASDQNPARGRVGGVACGRAQYVRRPE
jgi:hypothetical protein